MRPDVWAPNAQQVDLVLGDGTTEPLLRSDDGWFRTERELHPGDRYAFALDGGPSRPDPRSRWQPDGVHGSSAVDPVGHVWTDDDWAGVELLGGAIYEVHIGTFTPAGTLDAAIERLDHVARLGVTAIELMPVAESMGARGWGYDGVDLFAVDHHYGGPAALRRFVDAAHRHGLAVLLDVVYNHLGPEGAYLGEFGPYFTDRHHTPWGPAVNLDGPGSDEVRRFIVDNAVHWCRDHHIDGLRIDAAHALIDTSPTHIVAELTMALDELGEATGVRRWVAIEREDPEHRPLRARGDGGWGVDLRWADDLHHAIHARLTGEGSGYYEPFGSTEQIGVAMRQGHIPPGEPRPHDLAPTHLVTCTQNHDQIGNRASGDRLVELVGTDGARAAAALVLLGPGTPLLFMGEEWGASTPFPYFCDTDDADLAERIRTGRRAEFDAFTWDDVADPLDPATFAAAHLRWDELTRPEHREMLEWYSTLLRLRRDHPEPPDVVVDGEVVTLRRGELTVAVDLGAPTEGRLAAREVSISLH